MAICQDIIRTAYRRSGIVAAGTKLSALQTTIGLECLTDMYLKMIGDGMFGRLVDYYLATGPLTACEWTRVLQNDPTSVVTIPQQILDPSTGLMRAPYDGAFIEVTNPYAVDEDNNPAPIIADWLYDVQYGWMNLQGLTQNSQAPFSGRYLEGIKNMLAVALGDENGVQVPAGIMKSAALDRLAIASRYDSLRKTVYLYNDPYDYGFVGDGGGCRGGPQYF